VKAVILDVDGTLIESMAVDTRLYFDAVRTVLGAVTIRERLEDYEHVTDRGILAQIFADNGLAADGEAAAAIQSRFVETLAEHIRTAGPFPVIPGAPGLLAALRQSPQVEVGIATGGWRRSAMLKLDTSGFNIDGIAVATCDDSVARIGIMRCALAKLGNEFESVTYFGDAEWDRRACEELGWDFVAVGPGLGGLDSFENFDVR